MTVSREDFEAEMFAGLRASAAASDADFATAVKAAVDACARMVADPGDDIPAETRRVVEVRWPAMATRRCLVEWAGATMLVSVRTRATASAPGNQFAELLLEGDGPRVFAAGWLANIVLARVDVVVQSVLDDGPVDRALTDTIPDWTGQVE